MCEDLVDSDRGDFRCRRAVDSSNLIHLPLGKMAAISQTIFSGAFLLIKISLKFVHKGLLESNP